MRIGALVLFLDEQIDEVNAGGFGFDSRGGLGRWQLGVHHRIDPTRYALRLALKINLYTGRIERVEAGFDGLPGQMRRGFVEAAVQLERAVTPHETIEAMEEETAEVRGRRQLADVLDIALPAEQGRGSDAAVLGAVVAVQPGP